MPITPHVVKHAGVALCGQVVSRFVGTLVQVVLARGLGAAEFGLYALGWSLVRWITAPLVQSVSSGLTYFGARYVKGDAPRLKSVLVQSLLLAAIEGGAFALLIGFGASILARRVFGQPSATVAFVYFSPAFALFTAWWVVYRATMLSQRMQYSVYMDLATQMLNLLLVTAIVIAGWRLRACIAANLAATALGLVLGGYYLRTLFPAAFERGITQTAVVLQIVSYGLPTVVSGFAGGLVIVIDRLFVAAYRTPADLGIYQAASQVPVLFAIVIGALASVFAPMIADFHHRRDRDSLRELFAVTTKWSIYISVPLFLMVAGAPGELLRLLYGRAYLAGSLVMLVLTAGQLANVSTGMVGQFLLLTGNQRDLAVIAVACGVGDVGLNFLLVPRFGMIGAALASAMTCVAQNLITLAVVKQRLLMSPYDRRYLGGVAAAGATVCAMLIMLRLLTDWRLKLLAAAGSGFCIFPLFLISFGLDPADKAMFLTFRHRFIQYVAR